MLMKNFNSLPNPLNYYNSILFDCDGVLLNSNNIKTEAFYLSALKYGDKVANKFKKYHLENGGKSRYEKFNYLLNKLLKIELQNDDLDKLLLHYSNLITSSLVACEMVDNLTELRKISHRSQWYVVSGGKQSELRQIFQKRNIDHFFSGGIHGSPDPKERIFDRLIKTNHDFYPAIYFGDSKYDYEVSKIYNIDFIFVSDWSEFHNWKEFCEINNISSINKISNLLISK